MATNWYTQVFPWHASAKFILNRTLIQCFHGTTFFSWLGPHIYKLWTVIDHDICQLLMKDLNHEQRFYSSTDISGTDIYNQSFHFYCIIANIIMHVSHDTLPFTYLHVNYAWTRFNNNPWKCWKLLLVIITVLY